MPTGILEAMRSRLEAYGSGRISQRPAGNAAREPARPCEFRSPDVERSGGTSSRNSGRTRSGETALDQLRHARVAGANGLRDRVRDRLLVRAAVTDDHDAVDAEEQRSSVALVVDAGLQPAQAGLAQGRAALLQPALGL